VLHKLSSQDYPNVFGLKTKHHGRVRTYYLAAASEKEMDKWVEALCCVLHMDCACEFCLLHVVSVEVHNVLRRLSYFYFVRGSGGEVL